MKHYFRLGAELVPLPEYAPGQKVWTETYGATPFVVIGVNRENGQWMVYLRDERHGAEYRVTQAEITGVEP